MAELTRSKTPPHGQRVMADPQVWANPPLNGAALLVWGYGVGLLLTGLPGGIHGGTIAAVVAVGLGLMVAMPRWCPRGPRAGVWLLVTVITLGGIAHGLWRIPTPSSQDISHLLTPGNPPRSALGVTLEGTIAEAPRLTRNQQVRFRLIARQVTLAPTAKSSPSQDPPSQAPPSSSSPKAVDGSVYVTVPLLQGTGLYPGQGVSLRGQLYQPRSAQNPGGFDFQAYLNRTGTFAGLRAQQVKPRPQWDLHPNFLAWGWQVRQRIVQAQARALPSPMAPLVSAIALGRKAVDLPYDVQDAFARIGLSHTIAASGFHVSLLLGVVLGILGSRSPAVKFTIGLLTLGIFVALTGLQPSILRAVIMGAAALAGMTWNQRLKSLGMLLVTAGAMLLVQPLWIFDLGFQLSFLATFGLLATATPLARRWDILPPFLANSLAIPLAATLWTLPLQLFQFGLFSPYSLPINVLTVGHIWILSLGGIASALVAVVWPLGGTAIAHLLYYPTQNLLHWVDVFNQLPGSTLALGNLTLGQLLILYGIMGGLWWQRASQPPTSPTLPIAPRSPLPFQNRAIALPLASLLILAVILIPGLQRQQHLSRLVFLSNLDLPTAILQHHGHTALINPGGSQDVGYTLLPFLRREGVNHLDWGFNSDRSLAAYESWDNLLQQLPIRHFYDASPAPPSSAAPPLAPYLDQALQTLLRTHRTRYHPLPPSHSPQTLGPLTLSRLDPTLPLWDFTWDDRHWIALFGPLSEGQKQQLSRLTLPPQAWLWWPGYSLPDPFWKRTQWQGAIAQTPSPQTLRHCAQNSIPLYRSDRQALFWDPHQGIQTPGLAPLEGLSDDSSIR